MKKTNSLIYLLFCFLSLKFVLGVQILSKSKLETCEKTSDSDNLNCSMKIVVNMAVPTESSGREASIIAEIVEVEDNSSNKMQTVRIPPTITVNKSAAYAIYELTYIRDVPYKPEEFYVKTRKCEPDADAKVVAVCERLRDEQGHVMEYTQPICCPCGTWPRVPSSCGNFFDKMLKGKPNTAHCLRFPGDWFHVFGIGRRSIGFSVRIEVKKGTQVSEVFVGPENRTVSSTDNFLRVNLIGDFAGYTSIPSFEDFYLVIPRQGGPGQPENLGGNFSMWMLLERVRFTLDGLECNKIGVSYEAYNGQPNFCASPFWSCLHNQLWNFWDADRNRISRSQLPLYGVEGRFERINQHPNAGSHSFSIGITEVLNSNLLIELNADDIEYVFQRSPGKIISVTIPTFEALTQFGVATVTTKNIGKLEASYSLTFDCSKGITLMEEQFFIMKAEEIAVRSFKLYPTIDQAAKYVCSAILKDSDFNEVDRAECQFTTTATILDNGSQTPFEPPKNGANGIFSSIGSIWKNMGDGFIDFITGKSCRSKCSGFFDFSCHIQYICMSWVVLFGLLLAIFPTVMVLLWLLHQKGFFDPLYDWWDDIIEPGNQGSVIESQHVRDLGHHHHEHLHKYHKHEGKHYKHHTQSRRRSTRHSHRHVDPESESDYHNPKQGNHLYHAHQYRFKHEGRKSSSAIHHGYSQRREKLYRKGHRENLTDERFEQHGHGKKWEGL